MVNKEIRLTFQENIGKTVIIVNTLVKSLENHHPGQLLDQRWQHLFIMHLVDHATRLSISYFVISKEPKENNQWKLKKLDTNL